MLIIVKAYVSSAFYIHVNELKDNKYYKKKYTIELNFIDV